LAGSNPKSGGRICSSTSRTAIFAPFYPAAIRTFGLDQLEHARQWAKVGDVNKAAD